MSCQILRYDAYVLNIRMRMPFRFGISTMTFAPHLFLRIELAVDGTRAFGVAADHLPQKWFTKNPQTSFADDIAEMIRVIRHAADTARALPAAISPFQLWQVLYEAQATWANGQGYPPLLAGFGTSLVERAMIDAFCRATGTPFSEALRRNTLGIEGLPLELLPAKPLQSIIARHTVGLIDPIDEADIPPGEVLNDGLPQSLDQCIRAYGLTHFKIKLCGDVERDSIRLRKLAKTIGENARDYAFTLDGNENFHHLTPFRELWQSLHADEALEPFLSTLIFVEQPLHRDVALSDAARDDLLAWTDRPPMIIDESDATMAAFPRALECGYVGTSHKNCKGVLKGVINACRVAELRRAGGSNILSGEDLSNVGPIALIQDLAVMANLGIAQIERNGHHYCRGLTYLPADLQETVAAAHPDVYRHHPTLGFPTLDIRGGRIEVGSAVLAPFGAGFEFDPSRFTPLEEWTFESASTV